jgi:DNA-binding CsgD family transcriptional regulator/transcription elongation factor Elf1
MDSKISKIIELRKEGKSFRIIAKELECSQSTVSKWCNRNGLGDIGLKNYKELSDSEIIELKEFYKTHTKKETSIKFGVSETTVIKHSDKKTIRLSIDELHMNMLNTRLKRRQIIKKRGVEYKGGKCSRCNYDKCMSALDFHHLDPSKKDFTISKFLNLSWEKIKIELDKCELVCSNCHREIHHNERMLM